MDLGLVEVHPIYAWVKPLPGAETLSIPVHWLILAKKQTLPSLATPPLVDQRWHMCLVHKATRNAIIKHSIDS